MLITAATAGFDKWRDDDDAPPLLGAADAAEVVALVDDGDPVGRVGLVPEVTRTGGTFRL